MVPENIHRSLRVFGISTGERGGCPKRQSIKPKLEFLKRWGGPYVMWEGYGYFLQ